MAEPKLELGMIGVSLAPIAKDAEGWTYIYDLKERVKVRALEDVRLHRELLVVELPNHVLEHTPEELKYETQEKTWARVSEDTPLPITGGGRAITHVTVTATASGNTEIVKPSSGKKVRVHYFSYSNAHNIQADVGMRFGGTGDIKHRFSLPANGGAVNANLIDANWEGAVDEILYAYLTAAYASGIYFTVGYTEE